MPSALNTETVLIHSPEEPRTGGPNGPTTPEPPGGGGGRGDNPQRHEPTGVGMFGMRIALVPVTILFLAIAYVFYLRSRTGINWQSVPVPSLLWLSTALILASSWTLERARAALKRNSDGSYTRWLLRTLYLGLGFLASQALALQQLVTQGLYMRHNPHSSLFYVITAAHGIHLLGGLAAMAYLLICAALHVNDAPAGRARISRVASVTRLYWHFLTMLWVGLFLLLVLWK